MTASPTVEHRRKRKTLGVPTDRNSTFIPTGEAINLLKITSRTTRAKYLKTVNLTGQDYLTWEEFSLLLALNLFLKIKPGSTSYHQFSKLVEWGKLGQIFVDYQIDITKELEKLRHEYFKQQLNEQRRLIEGG